MIDALFLSIIVASISFTVTEARLFKPIRVWIKKRNSFWGSFLLCGYCFGHWIAFALVAIYKQFMVASRLFSYSACSGLVKRPSMGFNVPVNG
jgi:alpha/beta superfamily hydrolase